LPTWEGVGVGVRKMSKVSGHLRKIRPNEAKAISGICKRNNHRWFLGSVFPNAKYVATNKDDSERVKGAEKPDFFFYILDKDLRGFMVMEPHFWPKCNILFALVDKAHRRNGVLRGMMSELESMLPTYTSIDIKSMGAAYPAWRKMGFVEKKPLVWADPERDQYPDCYMSKALSRSEEGEPQCG